MTSTIGEKLREVRGTKSQPAWADELGLRQPHVSEIEHSQVGMSEKAATEYGRRLGVDPAVLMVMHGFEVAGKRAARGELDAGDLVVKTAKLLSLAHQSGAVSDGELRRLVAVGQGIVEKARKGVATKSRPADTQTLLGRDGLGRSAKKSGAGVRSSFADSIPVDSPRGHIGSGRPSSLATVADPSARSLVDAVASLEDDIANGITQGAGILSRVASIVTDFENVNLAGDKDAADAFKRLKQLADTAAAGIGTTTATKTADAQGLAGRDALGRARTKRYG